ncbi:hypothetical protein WG66_004460 [Moniliophthora roreri]|nr:hypothetical protein WG66_004460 [Moniliophthora roreri]
MYPEHRTDNTSFGGVNRWHSGERHAVGQQIGLGSDTDSSVRMVRGQSASADGCYSKSALHNETPSHDEIFVHPSIAPFLFTFGPFSNHEVALGNIQDGTQCTKFDIWIRSERGKWKGLLGFNWHKFI